MLILQQKESTCQSKCSMSFYQDLSYSTAGSKIDVFSLLAGCSSLSSNGFVYKKIPSAVNGNNLKEVALVAIRVTQQYGCLQINKVFTTGLFLESASWGLQVLIKFKKERTSFSRMVSQKTKVCHGPDIYLHIIVNRKHHWDSCKTLSEYCFVAPTHQQKGQL